MYIQNTAKSPIRYVGGKSKYLDYIVENMADYEELIEPFCGGASVTLFLASTYKNKKYIMNDANYELYCFWHTLKNNYLEFYNKLMEYTQDYKYNNPEDGIKLYNLMNEKWNGNWLDKAVSYFILNRIVFGGMVGLASYSKTAWQKKYFTENKIKKLKNISDLLQNVEIYNKDYKDIIKNVTKKTLVFFDPPYEIKDNLYGEDGKHHENFNHNEFADEVKKLKCNWLITYNSNASIKDRFKDYNIIEKEYSYCVRYKRTIDGIDLKRRVTTEYIIRNYDVDIKNIKDKKQFNFINA